MSALISLRPWITESPVATIEDDLSQTEEEDLSYDDHVEAEQTALARILAASQAMPDVAQEDVPEKALRRKSPKRRHQAQLRSF